MHRTSSKGKARKEKPYTRINLPSVVQDRLSKYITGDTAQAGSSSRSDRKGKARKQRDVVKVESDDPALFGDDERQQNQTFRDTSEQEVAHELQQSHLFAHTNISSDPGSEGDEPEASESEVKGNLSNFENRVSGERGDRRKQDVQRPTQTFSSPLARFSHHSMQGGETQSDERPTVEELDKFSNDMNDLIDSFSKRAKSQVSKFIGGRRKSVIQ